MCGVFWTGIPFCQLQGFCRVSGWMIGKGAEANLAFVSE